VSELFVCNDCAEELVAHEIYNNENGRRIVVEPCKYCIVDNEKAYINGKNYVMYRLEQFIRDEKDEVVDE